MSEGRCAQDDLAVLQIKENQLPLWVQERSMEKLDFVVPLKPWTLILVYVDGSIWRVDVKDILNKTPRTHYIVARSDKHGNANIMPGGCGVEWEPGIFLTTGELKGHGTRLMLQKNEMEAFIKAYVVDSSEISDELGCSRQYVSKLVRENGLEEFKSTSNSRLFTRSELERIKGQ